MFPTGKTCTMCKQEKPLDEFNTYQGRIPGLRHHRSECKVCRREYGRGWAKKNPEKRRKTASQVNWKKYGISITWEDYNTLFAVQKGCCALCGRHESEFKYRLCVDHDHETGEIRGLLCSKCNISLGHYEWLQNHVNHKDLENYLGED